MRLGRTREIGKSLAERAPSSAFPALVVVVALTLLAVYQQLKPHPPRPWPAGELLYHNTTEWRGSLRAAVKKWNSMRTGVTWVETPHRAEADVIFKQKVEISCDDCVGMASQIGYQPGEVGVIYLTTPGRSDGARRLDDSYTTVISHEIGHIMGLRHTNDVDCSLMNGQGRCASDEVGKIAQAEAPAQSPPRAWVDQSSLTPYAKMANKGSTDTPYVPDGTSALRAAEQLGYAGGERLLDEIRERDQMPIFCGLTPTDLAQIRALYPTVSAERDPICWDPAPVPDSFAFARQVECESYTEASDRACEAWSWGMRGAREPLPLRR